MTVSLGIFMLSGTQARNRAAGDLNEGCDRDIRGSIQTDQTF
jgi:hypothetical protein